MVPYWLYQIQSHGTLLKWPKVRLKAARMAPSPLKRKLNMFTPSVVLRLVTAHLFEGKDTERVVKEKHLFGSAQAWWQAQPREWEQDGGPLSFSAAAEACAQTHAPQEMKPKTHKGSHLKIHPLPLRLSWSIEEWDVCGSGGEAGVCAGHRVRAPVLVTSATLH